MTADPRDQVRPDHDRPPVTDRRWTALIVIAVAQLMTALDATIVNIALPSAQRSLGFGDADRQWVITAYTLAFAGLLLLGGRIADRFGRRRSFMAGLGGFAAASALAGAAPDLRVLIAGRALQGAFAALLAPTALSLIAVTFPDRRNARRRSPCSARSRAAAPRSDCCRRRADGVPRLALVPYVNITIATARRWRRPRGAARPGARSPGRIQVADAILITAGLAAVVWAAAGGGVRLGLGPRSCRSRGGALAIAAVPRRAGQRTEPLLPPHLLVGRDRAGAYVAVAARWSGRSACS